MEIRLKETGQITTLAALRDSLPNVSGPLDALYDVIFEGPRPTESRYQLVVRDGVEEINGNWHTKYSVIDMSDDAKAAIDEQQATSVRQERNRKLAETDWRFRSDMTPSQDWVDYCQALRDVPNQSGFPWEVVWPEQPV